MPFGRADPLSEAASFALRGRPGCLLQGARNAIDSVGRQFLCRISVFLCGQTVGRVREIKGAIRFVNKVVGDCSVVCPGRCRQNGGVSRIAERFDPVDVALPVSRDGQAAAGIQRHPRRSRFVAPNGAAPLKPLVAGRCSPQLRAAICGCYCWEYREEQIALVNPDGAFCPGVSGGQLVQNGAVRNDVVGGRMQPLDFRGTLLRGEGRRVP